MSKKTCTCNNPKCPKSPAYSVCEHCMCLSNPYFLPSGTMGGPTYRMCCKCGDQEPTRMNWGISSFHAVAGDTKDHLITNAIGKPLP